MRFLKQLLLGVAVLSISAGQSHADIITLIGGTVRNGDLNDLTGAMQLDGATTSAADTDGDGTRAANSNANAGANVTIPFWTAERSVTNNGGNAFFGFDNSTGTALGGAGSGAGVNSSGNAFLYNNGETAGTVDLIHDTFAIGVDSLAGTTSTFTLTYLVSTDDADSDILTVPVLSINGTGLTPTSLAATAPGTVHGTGTGVLLDGADSLSAVTATFDHAITLVSTDTIDLVLDNSQPIDSGAVDRAAIDDITLIVDFTNAAIPEPSSLAVLGLFGMAGIVRRRR